MGATIAGNGGLSAPGTGFPVQYKGIAYGAKVISVRVLGGDGVGLTSDVIAGLDWCITYKNYFNDKNSRLFTQYPENRVYPPGSTDDSKAYLMLSGTSMATPVVSATVALMLEANPSLTPNAVKAILAYTAQRMTAPNVLEHGNGSLNAEGAVRLARSIAQNSNTLAAGAQWIANPSMIENYSTIAGEGVLGALLKTEERHSLKVSACCF